MSVSVSVSMSVSVSKSCFFMSPDRIGRARPARPALATPLVPELARLLARSESSRDVLDCRLLLTSKFLSAGKPLAVRIRSKTGGPGECAPNRGSHGQTVRVDRSDSSYRALLSTSLSAVM